MAETIAELHALTDGALIRKHDEKAGSTYVHTKHYLDELNRRYQRRQTDSMLGLTRCITALTFVVTFATIVNVLIATGVLC